MKEIINRSLARRLRCEAEAKERENRFNHIIEVITVHAILAIAFALLYIHTL